jgi:hypothetical protein
MFLQHETVVLLCCLVLFGVALHVKEKGAVRVCVCVCVCVFVCLPVWRFDLLVVGHTLYSGY